ncbi:anion permease [Escherichia coli]
MLSLGLWVFGSEAINATAVGLLAVSLICWRCTSCRGKTLLAITAHGTRWSTWQTPVVMANGLTRSGFIDWFANTMSTHLEGFSPNATVIVLVLVFYFAHYLFASLLRHTHPCCRVILAVGKGILGVPMEQWCILLVLSIGIMGCLTPYATGPGVIIYGAT